VRPAPFQLHLPAFARCVFHLAQQDRPAVAELRHKNGQLVAGIQRGQRIHARNNWLPASVSINSGRLISLASRSSSASASGLWQTR